MPFCLSWRKLAMKTMEKNMQRFLIFILIVVFTCIVLTRMFMTGLDPVTFTAATATFKATASPAFNHGTLLMDTGMSQGQWVYLCKILMLVVIVLVAVLNYRRFIAETVSEDEEK
jgi:hypothetical protein